MTDRPDALLPCRFCPDGGKPDKLVNTLICRVCGAQAPIDVWNTRPTTPPTEVLELARKIESVVKEYGDDYVKGGVSLGAYRACREVQILASRLVNLLARPTAAPEGSVIAEIVAERKRQSEIEGWTTEHDDNHDEEQLTSAAVCYAASGWLREFFEANDIRIWPWDLAWWKPKDRRRDLIRAAALLVAEIERLDRLSRKEPTAAPEGDE